MSMFAGGAKLHTVTSWLGCLIVPMAIACAAGVPGGGADAAEPCAGTWRSDIDGLVAGRLVWSAPDRVHIVGGRDGLGWVGAIDTCAGTLADEVTVGVAGVTSSWLSSVAADGPDLYVFGSSLSGGERGSGIVARLSRSSLEPHWERQLDGSEGIDEGYDLVAVPAHGLWMAGSADAGNTPTPWAVRATGEGAACGFAATPSAGLLRAIATDGDKVYMAPSSGPALHLLRFDAGACTTSEPCPCAPEWSSTPIQIGTSHTEVRDLLVASGLGYAVGFAADSEAAGDMYAFAALLNLATGAVLATYRYQATDGFDAFAAVALDAHYLYVGGTTGWDGQPGFASATPIIQALPLPLASDTTPAWTASLSPGGVVMGLARDGDDGLYASATNGWVMRCTDDGDCP
jgi:hypothetical protein